MPVTHSLEFAITKRVLVLIALVAVAWCVMTFTHEMGHIIGGWCFGAQLTDYDLRPWRLPYSFFNPDPHPLVTLWSGPIFGAVAPILIALMVRRDCGCFIAHFCVLANGAYIAISWFSGDSQLDTTKLLENGAHPLSIFVYCFLTIVAGYVGLRRQCMRLLISGTPNRDGASNPASNVA